MTDTHTATIAIAGATGFVGRHIIRALTDASHHVRALIRDEAKARAVLPDSDRITLVSGDLTDRDALGKLVSGADAVVNAVGIIREAGDQTFRKIHTLGTSRLVEAAESEGSPRYVQISALGVDEESNIPYRASKFEAERAIIASALPWTILRPSLIHGPDGEFIRMARDWATGRAAPYVFMPYFLRKGDHGFESALVAPISVNDLARCVLASATTDAGLHEVIHLSGPEILTWPELLRFVRDHVQNAKTNQRTIGLPATIAAHGARAAGVFGLRDALPFDRGMALMAAEDSVASPAKARSIYGFDFAPFRETAETYLPTI